jgi:hypothetical protein
MTIRPATDAGRQIECRFLYLFPRKASKRGLKSPRERKESGCAMEKRLQKLTTEEVERIKKFYEYGPMVKRPIDEELARKGWLQPNDVVEGEVRAYEVSDAAYYRGRPVLFSEAGAVKEQWLIEGE